MSEFYRQTYVKINFEHLKYNVKSLQSRLDSDQKIFAMIKANAYGHGAVPVAQTLHGCGINHFGVATLDEGLDLRKQAVRGHIFILDGLQGPLEVYERYALIPVLHNHNEILEIQNQATEGFMVALKLDTGMGRLGFFASEMPEVLSKIKTKNIILKAVLSQLPQSDTHPEEFDSALSIMKDVYKCVCDFDFEHVAMSLSNSASLIDHVDPHLQWYRPGLALYGCYPHERLKSKIDLKPVLEWKTQIMSLKWHNENQSIGYGRSYITKKKTRIAILPVGYADGYRRDFANQGFVLVNGQRAPIAGRISMDLTAIDVTHIDNVEMGQSVTLVGCDGENEIAIHDLAHWAQTISYEILCGISARVPRK